MGHCQVNNLQMARTLVTSQLAICFAANIAFITLELALVTLEWPHAAVVQLVSGQGATLSTAVLALVTLVWAFATVGRFRFESVRALVTFVWAFASVGSYQFESLIFEKQVKVTEYNFVCSRFRWQMSKSTNVIFTFLIVAKVLPV